MVDDPQSRQQPYDRNKTCPPYKVLRERNIRWVRLLFRIERHWLIPSISSLPDEVQAALRDPHRVIASLPHKQTAAPTHLRPRAAGLDF
jgi:hypothetical protein